MKIILALLLALGLASATQKMGRVQKLIQAQSEIDKAAASNHTCATVTT
jgi:hypothetical protein